ncbi:MAG: hypothetical protein JXB48_19535 [Candidatus Latescibacteria bacterium]|nr:hypothetical protein [Candidatus Latescibacterota bacterium]
MSDNNSTQTPVPEKKDRTSAIDLSEDKKNTLSSLKDRFKNVTIQQSKSAPPNDAATPDKKDKISVNDIVERGKKKEEYYGSIGKKRAKETADKKENNERVRQSTFRMALKFFSLFNKLKGRALQYDRVLTYEILLKYSLDHFDKMEDSEIADVIDSYKE